MFRPDILFYASREPEHASEGHVYSLHRVSLFMTS